MRNKYAGVCCHCGKILKAREGRVDKQANGNWLPECIKCDKARGRKES